MGWRHLSWWSDLRVESGEWSLCGAQIKHSKTCSGGAPAAGHQLGIDIGPVFVMIVETSSSEPTSAKLKRHGFGVQFIESIN